MATITKTGVYVTPTREELLANGLIEDVQEYTSPVTFIKYRFSRFIDAGRTMSFVPLILQDENRQVKRLFINGLRRPVQQADETTINVSDADLIVRTMPELRLVKYPDDRDQTYVTIPGLHALHDAGYFFVGPRWCTAALFMLEANPGSQKIPRFTTIMSDRIPFGPGIVLERGQGILPGITTLRDPAVAPYLTLKGTRRTVDAVTGQETTDVQTLPGDQLLQQPKFISDYIKEATLNPTENISNVLIGSPFCVDLVSEFIVPYVTVQAVPQPVVQPQAIVPAPGGLLGGPQQQPTTGTWQPAPYATTAPSTATPATTVMTTTTSQRRIPIVPLTPAMVARLEFYLTKGKCAEGGLLVRIDNLVKVIVESQAKDGGSKWANKYLSLTSCRFAAKGTGTTVKRVMRVIPGTQQTLNLSITPEDLASIITGGTVQNLPQNEWDAYVEAVFKEIESVVLEHLGSTFQVGELEGVAIPTSILDTIPAGPSPAGRPLIIARSPFVEKVALSGVTEVTVPITDGKRCLPGLMAKKRD